MYNAFNRSVTTLEKVAQLSTREKHFVCIKKWTILYWFSTCQKRWEFIINRLALKTYEAILVVDRLKCAYSILLEHPYTAKAVVEIFTKEVIRLHAIHFSIISDYWQGSFWKKIFKEWCWKWVLFYLHLGWGGGYACYWRLLVDTGCLQVSFWIWLANFARDNCWALWAWSWSICYNYFYLLGPSCCWCMREALGMFFSLVTANCYRLHVHFHSMYLFVLELEI